MTASLGDPTSVPRQGLGDARHLGSVGVTTDDLLTTLERYPPGDTWITGLHEQQVTSVQELARPPHIPPSPLATPRHTTCQSLAADYSMI
ncbi:hypothetical protein J6590_050401 [Homalodisca vitripennis]|nr:hypothetical protein J6590_050401 [Homalodisca vitripennis]